MKYMLLIYVTEADVHEPPAGVLERHLAMTEAALERGAYIACDALESTAAAIRVRMRNGEVLQTDGPFAEVKEVLGGFYIVDCASVDEAVALAAKIPITAEGCIEIRRVAQIPGWDEAVDEIRSRVAAATA